MSSSTASKASFSSDSTMAGPCFDLGKSEKFLQILMFQPALLVLGLRQGRRSFTMITQHACFDLSGSGFHSSSATMKKLKNE